jgi:hypothetical protein
MEQDRLETIPDRAGGAVGSLAVGRTMTRFTWQSHRLRGAKSSFADDDEDINWTKVGTTLVQWSRSASASSSARPLRHHGAA